MFNQAVFVRGALALAVAAAFTAQVHASGFQLRENSAAALGRAFAGAGSAPGDAAIISNNPAGMRLLGDGYIVQGDLSLIDLQAEFQPRSGTHNTGQPLTGGGGGDAGDLSVVPAAYFGMPIGEQMHLGVYVDAPFGLKTEYDDGWIGRYSALKSELRVVDLGLAFSYDVNPYVSFGASVFAERADAELSQAVDFGLFLGQPQQLDGAAVIEGDNTDWGFKLGALFSITDHTHLGVTYRSEVEHEISGDATFYNVPAPLQPSPLFQNGAGGADLALPRAATLSVFHQVNDRWSLMGELSRTAWSSFDRLTIDFANPGQIDVTEVYEWRDTWAVSIGAEYRLNEQWLLRGGIGYDQTPTQLETRNVRVPDADRRLLGLGLAYQPSDQLAVNVGYLHLFTGEPEVTTQSLFGRINGNYDININLLSASVSYRF